MFGLSARKLHVLLDLSNVFNKFVQGWVTCYPRFIGSNSCITSLFSNWSHESPLERCSFDEFICLSRSKKTVPKSRIRSWVPPPETRHKYVPIGSSKTSLFLEVSRGGTQPLLLVGALPIAPMAHISPRNNHR